MSTAPTPEPEQKQDRILDHEYDGIREYDNPLPAWWTWILWATIAYAGLYALNVVPGVGSGKGRIASYEAEMEQARALQAAREAAAPAPESWSDDALVALTRDSAALKKGRVSYETNCTPCHRADAGGSIGPNLTDEFWIHGGTPNQILATVSQGIPDKGMPTWSQTMRPEDIAACVAYVMTLHDTHPPNPKEPQGTKVESESESTSDPD